MKPRLLDLFCGAGGAAMGYHRAGFEVVGVDINPQPRYPFEFIQADALEMDRWLGRDYDVIHASPPCQMFSSYRRVRPGRGDEHYVNLIPQTREMLRATGLPYVIENVHGAPLHAALKLCGSMFDPPLDVQRHRYFETSGLIMAPSECRHDIWPPNRFPGGRSKERTGSNKGLARGTVEIGTWDIAPEIQFAAMGIDWMTVTELSQAIPPAYTEWIGRQLLQVVERGRMTPLSPKTREVLDWLDARRRETDQMFDSAAESEYTADTRNERVISRISNGPGSQLIPADRGRSRTRGMRP